MANRTFNKMLEQLEEILEDRVATVLIQSGLDYSYSAVLTTASPTKGVGILASGTSHVSLADCLDNLLDEVDDINDVD